MGPADAEPWHRCRSTRVEEMAEAVPGFVRAGRPRSRGASSKDIVPPRSRYRRSIRAPLVVEGGPSVFVSLRGPSVESRTGALTIGSGGVSVAFASGAPSPRSVRLPYHVSSPRSPNRTCGFPASRLSSGIMRLAHRSPLASVDDSYGIGTRPPLHPLPLPGCRQAC